MAGDGLEHPLDEAGAVGDGDGDEPILDEFVDPVAFRGKGREIDEIPSLDPPRKEGVLKDARSIRQDDAGMGESHGEKLAHHVVSRDDESRFSVQRGQIDMTENIRAEPRGIKQVQMREKILLFSG